jgi:hypothetical protein
VGEVWPALLVIAATIILVQFAELEPRQQDKVTIAMTLTLLAGLLWK